MRLRKFTLATSVAALLFAGASPAFVSPAFARGGKKEAGGKEMMPASMSQQFEWENKVVGPKEGLDQKKVAATREQGIREEEERKKQAPVKQKKVVADPASATLPTMDIEKPAAPTEKKQKKVTAQAPRQKDALDNLLDEQGIKPNNPSGGGSSGGGLDGIFASESQKSGGGKKAAKKTRRGRN
jgi:hypothetical protein